MTKLPPIPNKKNPKFPDPDIYKTKIDLCREIRDLLMKLYNLSKGGRAETIMKFIGIIVPGSNTDPDRLPYLSKIGKAKRENRMECIFALVSDLVLAYWQFYTSEKEEDKIEIKSKLQMLQEIAKKMDNPLGLQIFNIQGNLKDGFELVERE